MRRSNPLDGREKALARAEIASPRTLAMTVWRGFFQKEGRRSAVALLAITFVCLAAEDARQAAHPGLLQHLEHFLRLAELLDQPVDILYFRP